jgi:maltose/moltooligosaccharide transporter
MSGLSDTEETNGAVVPSGESAAPVRPLSPAQTLWYSVANLGCGAFFSFNNYILPLFLQKFTNNAVLLGLMGSTHSVEGAVIQPIVGSVSDRFHTPLGRRRPFMLLFLPLSALFMVLTPAAGHLPVSIRLGMVILSIFLFTVFFNIGFDPYQALMPDITPETQRGRVMGVWALMGNAAQAGIILLAFLLHLPFPAQFALVAGLMVVTTLLTCATIHESHGVAPAPAKRRHGAEIREALRGLRTLHQAAKAMAVFAISGAGIGAVVPNLSLFVKHITHCSDGQASMMGFVLMIATVVGVLPFGWLADRLGAKKVVFIGFALIALAAFSALWVTTLFQITVILSIAGLGNAAQAASAYPLLTDLVPGEEVGFYTGFQSTALSLAQPIMVVLTGLLINHGHGSYRIIFAVCAVTIVIAMAVLTRVHVSQAAGEIADRNREQGREV